MVKKICLLCDIIDDKSLSNELHLEHSNECRDHVEKCPIRLHSKGPIKWNKYGKDFYLVDGNHKNILSYSQDTGYQMSPEDRVALLYSIEVIHVLENICKIREDYTSKGHLNDENISKILKYIEDTLDKIKDSLALMKEDESDRDSGEIVYSKPIMKDK